MIYFQQFLTAISLLQVPNGFSGVNDAEDAKASLQLLSDNIEATTTLISIFIPESWEGYVNSTEEAKREDLNNLLGNFTVLVANITTYGINVTGADECSLQLKSTLPVILGAINDTTTSSQEDIFLNIQSLISTEISKIDKQLKSLQAEYDTSCGQPELNCDGTSKSIVVEVNRLLPVSKRVLYDFLAELVVLAYELTVDVQLLHAYIASQLDNRVQNLTACIVSKIEASTVNTSYTNVHQSNETGSVLDSFTDLLLLSELTMVQTLEKLLPHLNNLTKQMNQDYLTTITNIRNAVFLANQTANSLQNLTSEFNVTLTCAVPDFHSVLNSSIGRALEEYQVGTDSLNLIYKEGLGHLNVTLQELPSIAFQLGGCMGSTTCDYLVEKFDRKTIEIPVNMWGVGNSTAVLLHQPVSAVRKSGYNIARDVLEQLEAGIVPLKACVKSSLY